MAPQALAASDPRPGRRVRQAPLHHGAVFRQERGVACSPTPRPRITSPTARNCDGENGDRARGHEHKGGRLSCVRKSGPVEGALPRGNRARPRLARDYRTPGDAFRRRAAFRSYDTQWSAWKASTCPSRRWSSRWRRAGQAFEGAIRSVRCSAECGSRSRIPPPGALGGVPCSCHYPLRPGVTGQSGCAARGDVHYWRSCTNNSKLNDLRATRSGPEGRETAYRRL